VPFTISAVHSSVDLDAARALFRAYGRTPGVDVCVVDFAEEIDALPGPYAESRGTILLAHVGDRPAGCVALKPVAEEVAEMKRLFVDPMFRGRKIGEALATAAIDAARTRGYARLRLDSLPSMVEAQTMYRRLGFVAVSPWVTTVIPGVAYLELQI
jgi:GNAT superfamily N-acetyltransferase